MRMPRRLHLIDVKIIYTFDSASLIHTCYKGATQILFGVAEKEPKQFFKRSHILFLSELGLAVSTT